MSKKYIDIQALLISVYARGRRYIDIQALLISVYRYPSIINLTHSVTNLE
jgi:hypothetical protein